VRVELMGSELTRWYSSLHISCFHLSFEQIKAFLCHKKGLSSVLMFFMHVLRSILRNMKENSPSNDPSISAPQMCYARK
jgi:hypothetical protein